MFQMLLLLLLLLLDNQFERIDHQIRLARKQIRHDEDPTLAVGGPFCSSGRELRPPPP